MIMILLNSLIVSDDPTMKESEKSSRLEMLDEASLTRQPEEVTKKFISTNNRMYKLIKLP